SSARASSCTYASRSPPTDGTRARAHIGLHRSSAPAGVLTAEQIHHSAHYLVHSQESSGAIPWFPGGHTDVWDHVECAMALTVTGLAVPEHAEAARRAYLWLDSMRRPDGGWSAKYRQGVPATPLREANHAAYPAVGIFHHLLTTGDEA